MIPRRKFIKQALLALPAAVIIPEIIQSCKKDIQFKTTNWSGNITIVGAGASGLYAAHLLKMYAPNATLVILEASNTFGGRVRELTSFADFAIELGAEEIHGKRSKWYEIVDSTNANIFSSPKSETDYIRLDSVLKDDSEVKSDTDFTTAAAAIDEVVTYSGGEKNCLTFAHDKGVPDRSIHYFHALIGNEYGTSSSRLSANGISAENKLWSSGEDNYNVANRSYKSIFEEKFSDAISLVRYNNQVKAINYTNAQLSIVNQSGEIFQADKIIVTAPIAILKRGDITFTPALSSEKVHAMTHIGMGAGMKVILKFNTRFWDASLGSLYANGPIPEYWYSGKGRGSDFVLTAFIMGEKAEYLSSQGANAIQIILADLDAIYGAGIASSQLTSSHITDWTTEPYIGGAYSYAMNGEIMQHRAALAKSIENKLFFAGEATHVAGHNSTVHGAIETAGTAVKELLDQLG